MTSENSKSVQAELREIATLWQSIQKLGPLEERVPTKSLILSVIVPEEQHNAWLSGDGGKEILVPYPAEKMNPSDPAGGEAQQLGD
jgi:hypothetical protein